MNDEGKKDLQKLLEQATELKGQLEELAALDFEGLEELFPEVYHKAEALTYATNLDDAIDSLINSIDDAMPLEDDDDE